MSEKLAERPAPAGHIEPAETSPLGDRRFGLSEMCDAAACTYMWANNVIVRGHVVGNRGITGGGARGLHRSFDYYAIVQFAVARAIQESGFGQSAGRAFDIAATFAHVGNGPAGDTPARRPGLPFPGRHTFIAASADRARCYAWKPGAPGDLLMTITADLGAPAVLVLDVQRVWRDVLHRLGDDPGEVLRAAYGGQKQ